jgi:hypothetical protein
VREQHTFWTRAGRLDCGGSGRIRPGSKSPRLFWTTTRLGTARASKRTRAPRVSKGTFSSRVRLRLQVYLEKSEACFLVLESTYALALIKCLFDLLIPHVRRNIDSYKFGHITAFGRAAHLD